MAVQSQDGTNQQHRRHCAIRAAVSVFVGWRVTFLLDIILRMLLEQLAAYVRPKLIQQATHAAVAQRNYTTTHG